MTPPGEPRPLQRWRPSLFALLVAGALVAYFLLGVVWAVVLLGSTPSRVGVSAIMLICAGVFGSMCLVHLDLYPDHLEIAGWLRRTRKVSLADLDSVSAGYWGLTFSLKNGNGLLGPTTVGSKSNLARWLRHHTRGDGIAEAIMQQAGNDATQER